MKYPHLLPREVEIWERFLSRYGREFTGFTYDVRVGEGVEVRPYWGDEIARMAKLLTMKRIDVVGYKPGEVWIIEVKPHGGLSALGQLIAYETLYRIKFNPTQTIRKALVCETVDPDLPGLLLQYDITLYRV